MKRGGCVCEEKRMCVKRGGCGCVKRGGCV